MHEYYNGCIDKDGIALHIPAVTQKQLRNEGVLIKSSRQGVQILYEESDSSPADDSELCIRFGVSFIDPQFFIFTSPELAEPGYVMWFDNRSVGGVSEGVTLLHEGPLVEKQNVKKISELDFGSGIADAPVIFELDLKPLIARLSDPAAAPVKYAVRFPARRAPWLFWLWFTGEKLKNLIGTESELVGLRVQLQDETETGKLDFQRLDQLMSMRNQTGVRFLSSEPIKLGACSDFKLSLVYHNPMGEKTLIEQLPHPAKDCLELLFVGDQKRVVASSHVSV